MSKRLLQLCTLAALVVVFSLFRSLSQRNNVNVSTKGRSLQSIPITTIKPEVDRSGQRLSNHTALSSPLFSNHYKNGLVKTGDSTYSRVVVIPCMIDDDISWISRELPDFDAAVYVANNPAASFHPPKNKGHEAMVYFTYIIDHYYDLPDTVVFIHAHRFSHHNSDLLGFDAASMIRRLSNAHVARQGYMNLRCDWSPGCPEWLHPHNTQESLLRQEEQVLAQSWNELFPHQELPRTLAQPCCAQFALSKDRILAIPLSQYVFYRDWILRTPLSNYVSGRIWEYSWQLLFAGQSVHCPRERLCYCDGFGVCFAGESEYDNFHALMADKHNHEKTIADLHSKGGSISYTELSISERVQSLTEQIEALSQELGIRLEDAIKRGDNPRIRAQDCNRAWHEGDGF